MRFSKEIFLNLVCAILLAVLSIYVIERLLSVLFTSSLLSLLKLVRSYIDLRVEVVKQIYLMFSVVAIHIDTITTTFIIGLVFAKLANKYKLGNRFWLLYLIIFGLPLYLSLGNAINEASIASTLGVTFVIILMWVSLYLGLILNKRLNYCKCNP